MGPCEDAPAPDAPAAPEPFAKVEDFRARCDTAAEDARVAAALEDASALLRSLFRRRHGRPWEPGVCPDFDDNARSVCCAAASRAVDVPGGMAGVTQMSETAGPFTASASFGAASGSLYVTKGERERLGLSGGRMGSLRARCGGDAE
ncbi:hypothetical protein E5332_05640 [Enterorhabdus sp. NM05_H27]|nr:hypothetical protein E5332_05640 [Enterorhabdus sp. NM05_H27]